MSKEQIIAEIKRVDSLINKTTLSRADFDQHAQLSSSTVHKKLGSWRKALEVAGLAHKYNDRPELRKARGEKLTNEEVIAELLRVAKILGKEHLTMEDFRENSIITLHFESVRRRFGSWAAAMKAAGLNLSPGFRRRYSNEEYFENLLNVWTHHGRQPTYSEIEQYPSTISAGAYEGRFGSWRKALEAFVKSMNDGGVEISDKAETEKLPEGRAPERERRPVQMPITKPEDRRGISLSLRYKVLVRDKFRCVRCGRSPATTLGLELEIDHRIPYSKDGRTTLENLETKCKDCNNGKSNRFSE